MPAGRISGAVVDEQGRPVHGARVYVVQGPVPVPDIAAVTDPGGRFDLAAPVPGAYTVGWAGESGTAGSAEVEVGGEGAEVTLRVT